MLTLNAFGKHGGGLAEFLRGSLKENENELKILIDGPIQVEEIRKFLEPLGFTDFILEDDEGNLYLTTSKKISDDDAPKAEAMPFEKIQEVSSAVPVTSNLSSNSTSQPQPQKNLPNKELNITIKHSTGVLISCGTGKYKKTFMQKILSSLVKSKIKPDVLGLMNGAVSLAAYNSPSCGYLKELEEAGVKILISESCADFMGITEAVGAGILVDMSEIFEEIFSCGKVVSL